MATTLQVSDTLHPPDETAQTKSQANHNQCTDCSCSNTTCITPDMTDMEAATNMATAAADAEPVQARAPLKAAEQEIVVKREPTS